MTSAEPAHVLDPLLPPPTPSTTDFQRQDQLLAAATEIAIKTGQVWWPSALAGPLAISFEEAQQLIAGLQARGVIDADGRLSPPFATLRAEQMAQEKRAQEALANPVVVTIEGRQYAQFKSEAGDGFSAGTYPSPVPCEGASIVVVAKPTRNGAGAGWTSIVDLFYDRLVLGVRNDSGLVCVRRNGSTDNSVRSIPDGQITISSLVVQPDGSYRTYANGEEIMTERASGVMTSLVPGVAGPYATSMTVGRNAPDGWTAFNGDIGDVFVYKVALSAAERQQLEALIAQSLAGETASK